jgi:hypothetical protein
LTATPTASTAALAVAGAAVLAVGVAVNVLSRSNAAWVRA